MSVDTSDGWSLVENPETVTYRTKTGEGTYTEQQVTHAKRRVEARFAEDLKGVKELTFHLWAAKLAGASPKRGDEIQDGGGVRWAIFRVEVQSLGQRFKCECRRL